MRCNTFARSALFAAAAAAGWLPWAWVAGPLLGEWNVRAFYLAGITALYIAALSPRSAQRLAVAIAVGLVASALALAARSSAELSVGLAVILGIARSGFLFRAAPARAVRTEVILLAGGLLFARFLAGSSPPSTGLAIWGFFLVQSLFFLFERWRPRPAGRRQADPFEEAYHRAVALLERMGI